MFRKLDNKGNTLTIVIIGIFVLSILGTLILGVTATNLSMKANENKNEKTFYYAEKAVDEIYAGIGNDVMSAIQESYTEVLENYSVYKNGIAGVATVNPNDKLVEILNSKLVAIYDNKHFSASNGIDNLLTHFDNESYVKNVTGYSFDYKYNKRNMDVTFYKKNGTDYTQMTTYDDVTLISRIVISNVGVKCTSAQGYSSSIMTDFEINIPTFNIDFSDSASKKNLGELAKYTLICQGSNLVKSDIINNTRNNPAILVGDGSNVSIYGNIYADGTAYKIKGTKTVGGKSYYVNDDSLVKVKKNSSIKIGKNTNVDINSKVINCNNDIEIAGDNTTLKIGNRVNTDTVDSTDTMQLFVNNIITDKGTSNANINITGNIMVKDDLQIDGDNSDVTLKGNYYGYGYREKNDNSRDEADTEAITGFVVPSTLTTTEHEKSSAIVVNGEGASLDMTGINKMILAGRAYIDLDANGSNTSYMTGESISFKGNQKMYLADKDVELSGSIISSNPIKYYSITNILGSDGDVDYKELMLKPEYKDKVVAKKIITAEGDDVYFYIRNNNPVDQTNYFISEYSGNAEKKKNMQDRIEELKVRKVLFSSSLKGYTVGAFFQQVSTESGRTEMTKPLSGEIGGMTKSDFIKTIDAIQNRVMNLTPTLNDVSESIILGEGTDGYNIIPCVNDNKLVFDYLIDREKLYETVSSKGTERYTVDLGLNNINGTVNELTNEGLDAATQKEFKKKLSDILKAEFGNNYINGKKIGYTLSIESGSANSGIEIDAGVIVTDSPYLINRDFVGLIICNGTMTVSGNNVSIKACEELTELFFEYIPSLNSVLNGDLTSGSEPEDKEIVNVSSINYTDIVDKKNWKKNNN